MPDNLSIKIIILLALLFYSSCGNNSVRDQVIGLDPSFASTKVDITEYIEYLEYIPIKESKDLFFNPIQKLLLTENGFLVKFFYQSSLYFFDKNGEYIQHMKQIGTGPMEYQNLTTFSLLDNDHVIFFDQSKRRLNKYQISNNKIVHFTDLDHSVFSLEYHRDYLYCMTNDRENGLLKVYNKNYELVNSSIFGPFSINTVVTTYPTMITNDTLFLNYGFTDTLYYAVNQNVKPYIIFGSEKTSLSSFGSEKFIIDYLDQKLNLYPENIVVPFGNIYEFDNVWIIEHANRKNLVILYDRDANKCKMVKRNNIGGYQIIFYPTPLQILDSDVDKVCYSVVMPSEEFYNHLELYLKFSSNKVAINAINRLLSEYPKSKKFENPIIVKFKLKREFFKDIMK